MNPKIRLKKVGKFALLTVVLLSIVGFSLHAESQVFASSLKTTDLTTFERQGMGNQKLSMTTGGNVYLPILFNKSPNYSPFGTESNKILSDGSELLTRANELGVGFVRLNARVSWRALQPNGPSDPIDFTKLATFDNELRSLKASGILPEVIIYDYPDWAVNNAVRGDLLPTSCGALLPEHYADFASFMHTIAAHYKSSEFNVHVWEMGNEPDVDPNLVPPNSVFGCWGDAADTTYYGGDHYGEMLKVVTPAIRSADPYAQVWIGGLLLDKPEATRPEYGYPEKFLSGILSVGAAPYFDAVPYHWYPSYTKQVIDYDNANGSPWDALGGGTVGKATYLRQVMASYDVSKPVINNETGLACPNDWTVYDWCVGPGNPDPQFYSVQADYLIRSFVRGLANGVAGFTWYTLNGPGWRYTGLLDAAYAPQMSFNSYKELIRELKNTSFKSPVEYDTQIEAYAFWSGTRVIQVVWAKTNQQLLIYVPSTKYIEAYDRFGQPLTPVLNGSNYEIPVSFDPIYVITNP